MKMIVTVSLILCAIHNAYATSQQKQKRVNQPAFDCRVQSVTTAESGRYGNGQGSGANSGRNEFGKKAVSMFQDTFGPSVEQQLEKTVREGNKQLPKMISDDLRIDSASSGPGKRLTYNYSVLKDTTCRNLRSNTVGIKQSVCSNKQMQFFFSKGVVVEYTYNDPTGIEQFRIAIDPSDCR